MQVFEKLKIEEDFLYETTVTIHTTEPKRPQIESSRRAPLCFIECGATV
jgi:hypothetical protein